VAAGGMLVMGLVGCAIARHIPVAGIPTPGLWVGIAFSVTIFITFLVVNWLLVSGKEDDSSSPQPIKQSTNPLPPPSQSLRNTIFIFVITSIGVIFSALWLLRICDTMAVRPITLASNTFTLGHSFVGSFLLALATSLPELFVSLGALKLGRVNMSIANIFGSNIMNMSFIPIMHLVSRDAGFYSAINPATLVMLFAAIIMSTLFIVGLMAKGKRSFFFLGWETITILAVYIVAAVMVFRMGSS